MSDLRFFKKGKRYLKLIKKTAGKKGLYYCEICGGERELNMHCVEVSGRYKTCGCCSSHKPSVETFYCKDSGYFKTKTGFIISNKIAKGYLLSTYKGKKDYTHRLVAENFIPNPNNYKDVNHKNGIKTDNRIENLEWCDRSYNIKHAYSTGLNTGSLGNISKKRKFTYEQYVQIMNSEDTFTTIGSKLNVSLVTISNIKKGKIYKNFYDMYLKDY